MNILKCKSYSEIGKILGYNYYNGNVKKQIIKFCEEIGLNADEIIQNNNKPNICLQCGREITGKNRFRKKFCNSSCAAKYNNKGRIQSEETKEKISKTLNEKYFKGEISSHNQLLYNDNVKKISELIEKGLILNPFNVSFNDYYLNLDLCKERICKWCGKSFKPFLNKSGRLSKSKYCSEECSNKGCSSILSDIMKEKVLNGRHQGWKTRNISSYPENFWVKVLESNFINYIREYHVDNKYFLDFLIEKNDIKIDLEIDGKQHLYEDRKQHDIERDKYLTENNYVVYRIPWNEINSEEGKLLMKNKINDFLTFFNTL